VLLLRAGLLFTDERLMCVFPHGVSQRIKYYGSCFFCIGLGLARGWMNLRLAWA
jgi:hypothetical protein